MQTFELDFEVYCSKCGAGLCNNVSETQASHRSGAKITIEPCQRCIEDADYEGYIRGCEETENKYEKESGDD